MMVVFVPGGCEPRGWSQCANEWQKVTATTHARGGGFFMPEHVVSGAGDTHRHHETAWPRPRVESTVSHNGSLEATCSKHWDRNGGRVVCTSRGGHPRESADRT